MRLRDFPSWDFTWRDLAVIVRGAPYDSPLKRALTDTCGHTNLEHAVMAQVHLLQVGNWQRGHGKKHERPTIPQCLLPPEERTEKQQYGSAHMDLDEMHEWLGWGDRRSVQDMKG